MRPNSYFIHMFLAALIFATAINAGEDKPEVPTVPFKKDDGMMRHTGKYEPLRLHWTPSDQVRDIEKVFPHPMIPACAYATARDGLYRTDDFGEHWTKLGGIDVGKTGSIAYVAFHPGNANQLYLAMQRSGIWSSSDGGKTAKQIASKASGLPSDECVQVEVYPGDPGYNTLLVAHGDSALGISRSGDDGATWSTITPDYYIHRLVCGRPESRDLFLVAAPKDEPFMQGVYHLVTLGQYLRRLASDVLVTDCSLSLNGHSFYVTTSDSGIFRMYNRGEEVADLGFKQVEWQSVEHAWSATADSEMMFLYEPRQYGMIGTTDRLATQIPMGDGLYTGNFVREGASIRANATGNRFYAAINGILYVGRDTAPYRVDYAVTNPPLLSVASSIFSDDRWASFKGDLEDFHRDSHSSQYVRRLLVQMDSFETAIPDSDIRISSKVVVPDGRKLESVTVDLTRLGGSERTQLFDDGKHGDEKEGDGIYATNFRVDRNGMKKRKDWRPYWPGSMGLTVSAIDSNGSLAGRVAPLSIFVRAQSFVFWNERQGRNPEGADGAASIEIIRDDKSQIPFDGRYCLKVEGGPDSWSIPFGRGWNSENITGYYAVSFMLKPVGELKGNISFGLKDAPTYTYPVTTDPVPIITKEHLVDGPLRADTWQRVVIPLDNMLKDADGFLPDLCGYVVFSGDGRGHQSFLVDEIRFYLNKKELESDIKVLNR
ncbi:MAG: hypothetical protein JXR97_07315 [Planctomycetes bacterium]|nr:hypothetical protein [Planctomycetota bacterium]